MIAWGGVEREKMKNCIHRGPFGFPDPGNPAQSILEKRCRRRESPYPYHLVSEVSR